MEYHLVGEANGTNAHRGLILPHLYRPEEIWPRGQNVSKRSHYYPMHSNNGALIEEGLRNLLTNCAGVQGSQNVVLIHEEGNSAVDGEVIAGIAQAARELGAKVTSLGFGERLAGPEAIPSHIVDAMARADVTILSHYMGAMLRLRPPIGAGVNVLNYATSKEVLASRWATVPYGLWLEVSDAVARELRGAKTWRVTCPLGTDLRGNVTPPPETSSSQPFTVLTFPIGTHNPIRSNGASGRLVIRWLASSANHDIGDGLVLQRPVIADVLDDRLVNLEGDASDVDGVASLLQHLGHRNGVDPMLINSWHAGINPQARPAIGPGENLNHWQLMSHNNPRLMHFHAVGHVMPGEVSMPVLDADIWLDDRLLWSRGDFLLLKTPLIQDILRRYPGSEDAFELNCAIGA